MTWSVEWDEGARKELRRLDPAVQRQILSYLRQRITTAKDPRQFGRAFSGGRHGLWRYRIGDCRLICRKRKSTAEITTPRSEHART